MHALRFSHGTRVMGGDISSAHQRVHGGPRQCDADRWRGVRRSMGHFPPRARRTDASVWIQ
eukprot:6176164-Pleurochrysis_carterae.AAC.1